MTALPGGTVTFMFTDIEGSTRLWEQYPLAMPQALARHDTLLRAAIEGHAGHVFKLVGDAFCAAFPTAPAALAATLAAQRALQAEPWSATGPLRVRMALHTGAAEQRDGDYVGPCLNRISRLLSAGHGGQVLLSEATYTLVRDDLPVGVSLRDMGERRLRDLTRPEHIYQLEAPDLPADFPALKTLEQRRTNLPVQLTPLIGRDRELAQLSALLRQDDVRLVTLTGPGGTGKTRLALQLAAELLDDYPDGVFFVDLAPIHDPQLVVPAIAQVLELRDTGEVSLLQTLQDQLRPRRVLLVLDNFEQLVAGAGVLAALLGAAPALKLLATSRVMLHLRGEREFPVPPLGLPDMRRLPRLEQLTQYEAVRLFIDRARDVRPDFEVTTATAPAIAEICHRLDGLPLAIELAAARTRMLPPEQLLQRLGLRLLAGGARDLPERQRTLRSTIEWSDRLLEPGEQALFRRLAVFAGGWTLEAAEAVGAGEGLAAEEVLELLASLLDNSLVVAEPHVRGVEQRQRMLEPVREYALERLQQSSEEHATRRRHADFYLGLAEQAEPELRGPSQVYWLGRLEREIDNLRAAMRYYLDGAAWEEAIRLASALWLFWFYHCHLSEARRYTEEALARAAGLSPEARAWLLFVHSVMVSHQQDYENARAPHEESLRLFRELGDHKGIAYALGTAAFLAMRQGQVEEGAVLCEQAAQHFVLAGSKWGAAAMLVTGAAGPLRLGNYVRAAQLAEQGLAIAREIGDRVTTAIASHHLGSIALAQNQPDRARQLFCTGLSLAVELSDPSNIAYCLQGLALVAVAEGQDERAARLWGSAASLLSANEVVSHPHAIGDEANASPMEPARARLGADSFSAAYAAGWELSVEQAVDYALKDAQL